ncbi:MAG: hypothetical protein AAB570_02870 [Patescibacteria group bacterium]
MDHAAVAQKLKVVRSAVVAPLVPNAELHATTKHAALFVSREVPIKLMKPVAVNLYTCNHVRVPSFCRVFSECNRAVVGHEKSLAWSAKEINAKL